MIDSSRGCWRKKKTGGENGTEWTAGCLLWSSATRQDQTLSYANVHWDHMEPLKGVN